MTEPNIVFLDRDTLPESVVLREISFAHRLTSYGRTRADETAARIASADIVITNKVRIGPAELGAAKNLKLIAVAATGTDNIDLPECAARGIAVSNVRGYAEHSVPEHTFALILALRRNLFPYVRSVRNGGWQKSGQFAYFDFPIRDLAGSTIGIFGSGALGAAVAALAKAFGMTVLFAGRKNMPEAAPGRTPFAEVLERADILTLHLPLTGETRYLFGAAEFAQMQRRPLLVNTARGGLVEPNALADALETGQISGAAFDVAEQEPPDLDGVLMRLSVRPDFILTPHVAWASQESVQRLADQLVGNITAFWNGSPCNIVCGIR